MIDPDRFGPWVSEAARALFRVEPAAPAAPAGDIAALRTHYDAYNRRNLAVARDAYRVDVVSAVIAGVRVDVVTPTDVPSDDRVLLCLHGGAFMWGRGAGALLEAVPVAASARMRVVAVEYALAPECVFPAAVEDVLAVFRALCLNTPPEKIGMYGCSAGGVLTAQVTARLIAEGDSLPGAIAMLCGTGLDMGGDSAAFVAALTGGAAVDAPGLAALPYLVGADPDDPLVFPGQHAEVLRRFPPSLLVTGTRDFAASSVSVMHRRLSAVGVEAELLHFDGMWHAFHMATTLPESRELFGATARFFGKHLA